MNNKNISNISYNLILVGLIILMTKLGCRYYYASQIWSYTWKNPYIDERTNLYKMYAFPKAKKDCHFMWHPWEHGSPDNAPPSFNTYLGQDIDDKKDIDLKKHLNKKAKNFYDKIIYICNYKTNRNKKKCTDFLNKRCNINKQGWMSCIVIFSILLIINLTLYYSNILSKKNKKIHNSNIFSIISLLSISLICIGIWKNMYFNIINKLIIISEDDPIKQPEELREDLKYYKKYLPKLTEYELKYIYKAFLSNIPIFLLLIYINIYSQNKIKKELTIITIILGSMINLIVFYIVKTKIYNRTYKKIFEANKRFYKANDNKNDPPKSLNNDNFLYYNILSGNDFYNSAKNKQCFPKQSLIKIKNNYYNYIIIIVPCLDVLILLLTIYLIMFLKKLGIIKSKKVIGSIIILVSIILILMSFFGFFFGLFYKMTHDRTIYDHNNFYRP